MTTDVEFRDLVFDLVRDTWTAGADAIAGADSWDLRYAGKEKTTDPAAYWARVSYQYVEQSVASHADENTHGNNRKRYESSGIVFVQVFAPKSAANASDKGLKLSIMTRDAFRAAGVSGEVWYENARINPLSDDGSALRWNVVAEFRYDEIM